MNDPGEKKPVILYTRRGLLDSSPLNAEAVVRLIDVDKAEELQSVAKDLGSIAVTIVARSGDLFQRISSTEKEFGDVRPVEEVPEGKVIVRIWDEANPSNSIDVSRLTRAIER
jgi:predicted ATPase